MLVLTALLVVTVSSCTGMFMTIYLIHFKQVSYKLNSLLI